MIKNNFKKFFRYCGILCSEYLTYPGTFCAAAAFFAVCLIVGTINTDNGGYCSILTVISDSDLYAQVLKIPTNCAERVAQKFIDNPLFCILFPTIVSFPAIRIFRANTEAVQKPVVVRANKRPYCAGLFASTFLSGFVIALMGIMLYVSAAHILFPPVSTVEDLDFIEAYSSVLSIANLIKKAANVCTVAGIYSVFTIIIYAAVHDKFLSLTLPLMIQYISSKVGRVYRSWLSSDMERSQNPFLIFINMINPINLTNHYSSWEYMLKLPFACFFVFAAVILAGLYVIYRKLMERSIGDKI